MLGVSTSWRSRSIGDGRELVRAVAALGVKAVELDFRLTEKTLKEALDELERTGIAPVSVHGVCPAPSCKKDIQLAEAFELSSDDEEERKKAVKDAAATIELAGKIGAKAAVFHCGGVPMEKVTLGLQKKYDDDLLHSDDGQRYINGLKILRLGSRGNTFSQLLKSLEELNEVAEKARVFAGIENRYYMREYPNFEELAIIFQRMAGSMIRYWHDTGHAQAQENLGVTPHEAYLKEFSGVMIGVHLHDVDGYTDHMAPPSNGRGGVDFDMVSRYLKPETLRILELKTAVTEEQARGAVSWLAGKGMA